MDCVTIIPKHNNINYNVDNKLIVLLNDDLTIYNYFIGNSYIYLANCMDFTFCSKLSPFPITVILAFARDNRLMGVPGLILNDSFYNDLVGAIIENKNMILNPRKQAITCKL